MPLEERTIVDIREEMVVAALQQGTTVSEVAAQFGVSGPTVRLWRERYRQQGRAGLSDRSHATRSCPHRTSEAVEKLIIAERKRWGWGSKKQLRRLSEAHPEQEFPARSTIDAILSRHGLVEGQKNRRPAAVRPFVARYEASEPAELMTIDFKGQFRLEPVDIVTR